MDLLIKSCFGRRGRVTAKISVDFLTNVFPLHGKEHEEQLFKAQLSVTSEVPAGPFGVFLRICGQIINGGKQNCFYRIRIFHNVYLLGFKIKCVSKSKGRFRFF